MDQDEPRKTPVRTVAGEANQGVTSRRTPSPPLPGRILVATLMRTEPASPEVDWKLVEGVLDGFHRDAEIAYRRATNNRLVGIAISLGGSLLVLAVSILRMPATFVFGPFLGIFIYVGSRYFRAASESEENAQEIGRLVLELKTNLLLVASSAGLSEEVLLSLLEQTKQHAALYSGNPLARERALRAGLRDLLWKAGKTRQPDEHQPRHPVGAS